MALDVVAIGSALVDILCSAEDSEVADLGLVKGSMRLVELEESERLYRSMGPAVEVSGGSAANTAVGLVSLGGSVAYLARVADDLLGRVFVHDITAAGVTFPNRPHGSEQATGRCLIFITPDAERTMCTHLGAAAHLGPRDIDEEVIAEARSIYLEGYLWDLEPAKDALRRAVDVAHGTGGKVAMSLSDPFCVERHRAEFLELVQRGVDVVFCNEAEAMLLYETEDLAAAASALASCTDLAAITRGDQGSVVATRAETITVPAVTTSGVVDTTGAGDLYASGFLFGLCRGLALERCARLGSLAAAEVISHVGARPQESLRSLAEEASLIPRGA